MGAERQTMTPAVVMNVFYTGLGIARSLGERGVPVLGLTSQRSAYGCYTRYAQSVFCPDSRAEPDRLVEFLIDMGSTLDSRAVLFPTRDDDLILLDRSRKELDPYFSLVVPPSSALDICLNKWETFEAARRAAVPTPNTWVLEGWSDVERRCAEVSYPCVLKPVSAHAWRRGENWSLVGERKAIPIASAQELLAEYRTIARANSAVLLQELIPGPDDSLVIAACYVNRESHWVAGFNTRKILQVPSGFGTGCIVQSALCPELSAPTRRLLESMEYQGIAEVEYKWDSAAQEYKLIEINPRPWDQHRLGNAAGVDLIYLAYCDHAGLPPPKLGVPRTGHKWIADDTFVRMLVHSARTGKPGIPALLHLARGRRIYGIWSAKDPLPSVTFWLTIFVPEIAGSLWRRVRSAFRIWFGRVFHKKGDSYETRVKKPQSLR